jgi:GTPase
MPSNGFVPPAICERAERHMKESTKESRQLKIVIVGHVDHGKSTIVGRLLH